MKVSLVVPVITYLMDDRKAPFFYVYARLQDNIIKNINKTHYLSNMIY